MYLGATDDANAEEDDKNIILTLTLTLILALIPTLLYYVLIGATGDTNAEEDEKNTDSMGSDNNDSDSAGSAGDSDTDSHHTYDSF